MHDIFIVNYNNYNKFENNILLMCTMNVGANDHNSDAHSEIYFMS